MIPQAIQPGTWLPGNPPCTFTRYFGGSAGSSGVEWPRGRAGDGRAPVGAGGRKQLGQVAQDSVNLGKPLHLYTSVPSSVPGES